MGLSVYPPILSRQLIGKHVPAAMKIVGGVIFYAVRVVSKKSRRVVILSTSCIL
jgi:hypothetical protein